MNSEISELREQVEVPNAIKVVNVKESHKLMKVSNTVEVKESHEQEVPNAIEVSNVKESHEQVETSNVVKVKESHEQEVPNAVEVAKVEGSHEQVEVSNVKESHEQVVDVTTPLHTTDVKESHELVTIVESQVQVSIVESQEQVDNSAATEESHKQVVDIESIDNHNVDNKPKNKFIICVGVPGSGKTTFAKNLCKIYPETWCRINQDDLGNRRACEDLVKKKLKEGKNVIVDRVNFDKNQRKTWIEIAWNFDVPVDAIIMDTSMEECSARINARINHPTEVQGKKGIEILNRFRGWMKLPEHREGIEKIIKIKPQPTVDSYNKQVIDEILMELENATEVKHDRSANVNKLEIRANVLWNIVIT
ncbi:7586_t:CDS:2 [Diversispora eburnea]|uniref:7586_t:CDS:1 n=1 Tax=Diversispora eburnea TaxID=1213867 RepID=A0A9N8ZHC3_9GLOM|nr:7586_t:CDS:2 [Diversispora eburnea]